MVALDACDLWPTLAELSLSQRLPCHTGVQAALGAAMPQLVPVLLNGMVYNEMSR